MGTSDPTLERVVHAVSHHDPPGELVRYDKAGKWYIEWPGRTLPRQMVTIKKAAGTAHFWALNDGTVFPQQYGGAAFIRELKKMGFEP